MAKKDDKDLIGFDPLAWMEEGDETAVADTPVNEAVVMVVTEPMMNSEEAAPEMLAEATIGEEMDSKLVLDTILNIQNVSHLYEKLTAILDNHDKVEIDASVVETIDAANLQLLIMLKQTAIKLQKEVTLDFPSDRFVESAQLLGLSEMLGVEQTASGLF